MAYDSSSKARLFRELSRSRQSSPCDDNLYMTATGTSFHDVLHSTPLRDSPQHAIPLRVDQLPDPFEHDDNGSTDMSIEIGRGVKGQPNADVSSESMFHFGNDDSQYEVTATPPIPPRNDLRKADNSLRREASVRRATESIKMNGSLKRTANGMKVRAASDALPKISAESDNSHNARDFASAPTAARNTRFVGSRQPSLNGLVLPTRFVAGKGLDLDHTPQRTANMNATVHSTTFTANQSFLLPNIPDITEMVSGVRKDGTPKSRSRFTSGSFKAQPHRIVESLPLPDEEKVIFTSLQTLKDRISELETENMEAQKRAEQCEGEIFDLRSRLQMETRRVFNQAGSDDETPLSTKSSKTAGKLEASLKAVQDRFNRAERKVATAQITVQRVTKERDALVTQIAAAYFSNEELIHENEEYHTKQANLVAEVSRLKDQVEALKIENESLQVQLGKGNMGGNVSNPSLSEAARGRKIPEPRDDIQVALKGNKRLAENVVKSKRGEITEADLASRIEREVQRYRDAAAIKAEDIQRASDHTAQFASSRSRSKSRQSVAAANAKRDQSAQRTSSAPPDLNVLESERTTELDLTRKSQQNQKRTYNEKSAIQENFEQDVTVLSDLDDDIVANLRKKIEEEHRARRLRERASTPAAAAPGVRRKSSLKGVNDIFDEDTGRFSIHDGITEDATKTGKTVRVQSPHVSESSVSLLSAEVNTADVSILSNTSRRRRRTSSTEAMTSAFIIPDITIDPDPDINTDKRCINHDTTYCTACPQGDKAVAIPDPIPASEREIAEDITDATLRPAQAPALALATVIKLLEDEITHRKLQRDAQNRLYNRHDPAVSKRRRLLLKTRLDTLTAEIEKRSDQVYALYDVLEGQKQAAAREGMEKEKQKKKTAEQEGEELEETLMSIGLDPVELSGRLARAAPPPLPVGLDGAEEWSDDSEELPWEGLSDDGSE